jgi:hypothetical protein
LQFIQEPPPDKKPGPDVFTAHFLQSAWSVINLDIMATFDAFWYVDARNFKEANGMLMVLLLKSLDAMAIKDYRPDHFDPCDREVGLQSVG